MEQISFDNLKQIISYLPYNVKYISVCKRWKDIIYEQDRRENRYGMWFRGTMNHSELTNSFYEDYIIFALRENFQFQLLNYNRIDFMYKADKDMSIDFHALPYKDYPIKKPILLYSIDQTTIYNLTLCVNTINDYKMKYLLRCRLLKTGSIILEMNYEHEDYFDSMLDNIDEYSVESLYIYYQYDKYAKNKIISSIDPSYIESLPSYTTSARVNSNLIDAFKKVNYV